jgi:glycine dehydrogenase subunit 1
MRYLPLTPEDRSEMLARIGVADIDALFADIPAEKRLAALPDLPRTKSEIEVERALGRMAEKNIAAGSVPFFVGCGAYKHHIPASVDHLIQRSEFLTSYTPYQPEIAQGTLHYLFEFQTQVAMLTGMEVANASMYDGSTATAEAVLMAHRITKRKKAVLAGNLHPHYRETVETLSSMSDHAVLALAPSPQGAEDVLGAIDNETSCVVVQTPDVYGHLHDLRPIAEKAHAAGALLIAVVTEIVSLGLVTPPGEMGADIVVAEGQSIGNGLNFGGPYVGLFASRTKHVRQMPGRLVGETVDAEGKRGFVLTLSTREQHIRREKATSNICTNSGLCTLAFSIHLSLLGEAGLRRLAQVNHANALVLAEMLGAVPGVEVLNRIFFNEFTIRVRGDAAAVVEKLGRRGVLGGVPASRLDPSRPELRDLIIVAATEVNTEADRATYAKALREVLA